MQQDTEEAPSEKIRPSMSSSGRKLIDKLIVQWMKQTGTHISFHQTEEQISGQSSNTQQNMQDCLQNQGRSIQNLMRKLKYSQQKEISLSASLETEIHNREDMQTKLDTICESMDTITGYINYISESLKSFEQHRINLSNLYNNVILKQKESIQKMQASNEKLKNLEKRNAQLENGSLLWEKRLQEAMEQKALQLKQLEDTIYKQQLQKNELAQAHTEEMLKLTKEQQQVLLQCENLQSRLQTVENEKRDIATQLQNKLLHQEQKAQEALAEQNKLREQLESANSELHAQKSNLASVHTEKNKIIEEQRQVLIKCESLQLQLNTMEEDKSNTAKTIVQNDALLSQLRDENSMLKHQMEAIIASDNKARNKSEALEKKLNTQEKELHVKTERIQSLEAILNTMRQRNTSLLNDVNRLEKKLSNEMEYFKNVERKLSDTKKDLHAAEMRNAEMQEALKSATAVELDNTKLKQKVETLQKEKVEAEKRQKMHIEKENLSIRTKHTKEMSVLRSNYETEMQKLTETIEDLKITNNNIVRENDELKTSLTEMERKYTGLKVDYEFTKQFNENPQNKKREATESLRQVFSNIQEPRKNILKDKKRLKTKEEYKVYFDPAIDPAIDEVDQNIVSTSQERKSPISYFYDIEPNRTLSQPLHRTYSTERESQKEQEEEVTSGTRKFFKSRAIRTYSKR